MIERLLIPLAGDALDERVLSLGIDLARQLGAAITGFIVEPFGGGAPADEVSLRAHAREVLGRFEERARAAGVPFEGHATQSSDVSSAILAAAEAHRCDMIVMATHGRGRLAGMLGGSHTRDVLSRTRLPVLVLP
jgi:nucleotide-binding universal stress UspA family protein